MERALNFAMEKLRDAHREELDMVERSNRQTIIDLQEQIKSLEEKNKKLIAEKESLSLERKRLSSENERFRKELAISQGKINSFEEKNQKLSVKRDSYFIKVIRLTNENRNLLENTNRLQESIKDLTTCQICLERFQSAGERISCKLKCPHIMCKKCADDWLEKVRFYSLKNQR